MDESVRDKVAQTDIRDVYPLTPMQQGILFHTVRTDRDRPYIEQFVFDSDRPIDAARLGEAWTIVVNRHDALRAAFIWEGVDAPIQVVMAHCRVPLTVLDLNGWPAVEVETTVAEFLRTDREHGFDITEVPLMRLTLFRHDHGTILVWTLHHLVMDGWSMPIVLHDVAAVYRGDANLAPEHSVEFGDFIDWLAAQDDAPARRFWSQRLAQVRTTEIAPLRPGRTAEQRGTASAGRGYHDLSPELSEALDRMARSCRVTLSTVCQAAWGLLLSRHIDSDEVVFGTTVAGRPAELPGVEGIVGVFISTIPHRMRIDGTVPVRAWLRAVQRDHLDAVPNQHIGLPRIQECAGLQAGASLFDSILVFENYPSENPDFDLGEGVGLVVREIIEDTGYPLTLTVLPRQPSIRLQLLYAPALFDDETTRTLLGRFETLLWSLLKNVDREVDAVEAGSSEGVRWADAGLSDPGGTLSATPDTMVRVLDWRGKPSLVGVTGALHVGNPGKCRDAKLRGWLLADGQVETTADTLSQEPVPSVRANDAFSRPAALLLSTLWTEIFGRPVVDADADFFRLGGDSLTAVRLTGRLRMALGTSVVVNDVLESRTLGGLLERLDLDLGSAAETDRRALVTTEPQE